jgi:type IV pilus assembly protein PilC
MNTFAYTARDGAGKMVKGAIEGDTQAQVVSRLQEMGYVITALRQQAKAPTVGEMMQRFRGVKLKDLSVFTRQLATMINAGLTIVASLSILESQMTNKRLKEVVASVRGQVEGGQPLSEAFEAHPDVFNSLFTNMVRAGETGGVLDEILGRLSSLLEKEVALRQKVKAAMVYPAVIATAAVGIVSFIVFYILPKFVEFFAQLDVALPAPTKFLIFITVATHKFWYVWILTSIIGVYGFRYYVGTPQGRIRFDRFKLRMPLFGPINRSVTMARFSRTLGTLVHSGVPILQSLEVVSRAVTNVVVQQAIAAVRTSVREGEGIAGPLQASGIFPAMVVQMVAVGERTGALDSMLTKVADFYDDEVEYAVSGLTSVLEPALIMVMGGVVGFVVISFYLPLFNLVGAIK